MSIASLVAVPAAVMLMVPLVSTASIAGTVYTAPEPEPTTTTAIEPESAVEPEPTPEEQEVPSEPSPEPVEPLEPVETTPTTPEPTESVTDDPDVWETRDAIVTFENGAAWEVTITMNEDGSYTLVRN